jgi:hypothetical protein
MDDERGASETAEEVLTEVRRLATSDWDLAFRQV